jgi:hypothetical protein
MNEFLIGIAGHAIGLDDATLEKLEADIPKFSQIISIYRKIRPDILQMESIAASIAPEVQTALKEIGASK